jgi:hypothetical protein
MDVALDFVLFSHRVAHNRLMNQFDAARFGDLQQLRAALTMNNVSDVDSYNWTALHQLQAIGMRSASNTVSRWVAM